jgi:hypothetical protein
MEGEDWLDHMNCFSLDKNLKKLDLLIEGVNE